MAKNIETIPYNIFYHIKRYERRRQDGVDTKDHSQNSSKDERPLRWDFDGDRIYICFEIL